MKSRSGTRERLVDRRKPCAFRYIPTPNQLRQKRADVFAETTAHRDGEAAVRRDIEVRARAITVRARRVVDHHRAVARDDLHAFGGAGLEVIRARPNQPEGFFRAVGKNDRVTYDVTFEVDVSLGQDGDRGKLSGKRGHDGR
jgi:hypothetical protein